MSGGGFHKGDTVTWASVYRGESLIKTGEVVHVVKPRQRLPEAVRELSHRLCLQHGEDQPLHVYYSARGIRVPMDCDSRREEESYLVAVPPNQVRGKGKKALPCLYWPRVSRLKRSTKRDGEDTK